MQLSCHGAMRCKALTSNARNLDTCIHTYIISFIGTVKVCYEHTLTIPLQVNFQLPGNIQVPENQNEGRLQIKQSFTSQGSVNGTTTNQEKANNKITTMLLKTCYNCYITATTLLLSTLTIALFNFF